MAMNLAMMLNYISAATALIAAGFWFLSARNKLPSPMSYYGPTPASDPFFAAMQKGILFNRCAAGFAAVSALSSGLSSLAISCRNL